MGKIGKKDMMLRTPIIIVDIFHVWDINFMSPFLNSLGNEYILLCGLCVKIGIGHSQKDEWVQGGCEILQENIFARYGMPKAIISDQGTHFDNRSFDALLKRYSILCPMTTPYHP